MGLAHKIYEPLDDKITDKQPAQYYERPKNGKRPVKTPQRANSA
ncbi:unnamed protein product, partial [marine sediment metagenome]